MKKKGPLEIFLKKEKKKGASSPRRQSRRPFEWPQTPVGSLHETGVARLPTERPSVALYHTLLATARWGAKKRGDDTVVLADTRENVST